MIEKLLVLQDRDETRLALESQLRAIPRDIATVEQKIAAGRSAQEAARGEMQQLEVKKKAIENEIGSAAERQARYKSQQLQVRKNDEYQVLGVEIEHTQSEIGLLEEEELRVMYAIDEAKRKLAAAGEELKHTTSGHEARISALRARATGLQSELQAAQEAVTAARSQLDEPVRRLFDRLVTKPGLPVVVAIHEGKCGGCHLKISANVDSERRKADQVVTCDQCGRIVYGEP
jgi:predicted  nucleic acid-binding Zn-ribbon protein